MLGLRLILKQNLVYLDNLYIFLISGGCGDEGSSSEDDFTTVDSVHIGLLNDVVLELKGLLHGVLRRGTSYPINTSSSCQVFYSSIS